MENMKKVTIKAAFYVCSMFLGMMITLSCASLPAQAETVYTAVVDSSGSVPLKLRSGPSTEYKVKKKIPRGSTIKVYGSIKKTWVKAKYKGTKGYVCKRYLTKIKKCKTTTSSSQKSASSTEAAAGKVKVNTNGTYPLRIRKGPSTSYDVVGKIPRGSYITISGDFIENWVKAEYNGISGYVCTDYLELDGSDENDNEETQTSTSSNTSSSTGKTYKKISLDIVSYLQADPKWKDAPIGTSGGTIGSIGCATTCMAMADSYYKQSKITPLKESQKRNYTAGGCIYWDEYATTKSTSDYLGFIYKKLKNGDPVLCGRKRSNGSQHWVLITGYTGEHSDKLNSADFTINDPAGRCSTLYEFITDFVNPYELAYRS